jgi:hypothetical protein
MPRSYVRSGGDFREDVDPIGTANTSRTPKNCWEVPRRLRGSG